MIQFFRKIRRVLLNENKFTKYLLYAIGEIFLVVIGILLALQINNWNEKQKKIKLAKEYLIEISNDLKNDTTNFNASIKMIEETIAIKTWGLKKENFNNASIDTLNSLINITTFALKMSNQTFEKMKNEDIFGLSVFKDIFSEINNYYTFQQQWFNLYIDSEIENGQKEVDFWFSDQQKVEAEVQLEEIPMFQSTAKRKQEIISMILSIQGRNHLKLQLANKKNVLLQYEKASSRASELISKIKKKLLQLD